MINGSGPPSDDSTAQFNRERWEHTNELNAWRDVGQRLWPHVRHFGLCGADPAAVQAMVDLATCLGRPASDGAAELAGAVFVARQETIRQCSQWLLAHRYNGRKVRRSDMEQLAKDLQREAEDGGRSATAAEATGSPATIDATSDCD
jgi:hypothetical protein